MTWQQLFGGGGGADPDIIYNSCFILKAMLKKHVTFSEPISS
jgi:hypothetical protein